jgi:hypothetical protein
LKIVENPQPIVRDFVDEVFESLNLMLGRYAVLYVGEQFGIVGEVVPSVDLFDQIEVMLDGVLKVTVEPEAVDVGIEDLFVRCIRVKVMCLVLEELEQHVV